MRFLIDLLLFSLTRRGGPRKYHCNVCDTNQPIQPYQCTSGQSLPIDSPDPLNSEVDLYLIGSTYGVIFTSQEVGPLSKLAARYDRGEFKPQQ